MPRLDDIIGTKEAADMLATTPEYVARLCEQGKLEAKRVGRDWIIHRRSVEARAGIKRSATPKVEEVG